MLHRDRGSWELDVVGSPGTIVPSVGILAAKACRLQYSFFLSTWTGPNTEERKVDGHSGSVINLPGLKRARAVLFPSQARSKLRPTPQSVWKFGCAFFESFLPSFLTGYVRLDLIATAQHSLSEFSSLFQFVQHKSSNSSAPEFLDGPRIHEKRPHAARGQQRGQRTRKRPAVYTHGS